MNKILDLIRRFGNYALWAMLVLLAGAVTVLAFLLRSKDKKLKAFELELQLKSAKLQLENVLIKNRVATEDLGNLKALKENVRSELYRLERQLESKLSGNMSAVEIVEKLREVGFPR